jgi:hypothetical protein
VGVQVGGKVGDGVDCDPDLDIPGEERHMQEKQTNSRTATLSSVSKGFFLAS